MTIDLATITTPFGLLDAETQAQLQAAKDAGMQIEFYINAANWNKKTLGQFSDNIVYRLAPGQVWSKPEPKRAVRYVHMWEDGYVSLHSDKPSVRNGAIPVLARSRVEVVEGRFDD